MLQLDATGPLYHQVYRAFRKDILSRTLLPGERVPSTRALADLLKISRNTAVLAYEQLLGTCGSENFELLADDDEGCAKRICTSCGSEHFICDSEEYWSESAPEKWKCIECGSTTANVGVGFSLYNGGEIRWLYVGERCSRCGILGCFAGWKVAYSPSKQLLEQV